MTAPSRRWRPVAIVAAAALVLVALLASLGAFAPASLTSALIARAERASGRTITVAGGASLSLLPIPSIVLHDATVSNPPGFPDPVMAHAKTLRASFDVLALLSGRIEVESLSLADPAISLERLPDGRANWEFHPAPRTTASPRATQTTSPPRQDPALTIDSVTATGGALAWRIAPPPGGRRTWTGRFEMSRLRAQVADARSSVTLALLGRHGGAPFELSAAGGAPARLASATPADPWPLRAVLALGPNRTDRIALDGTFADPRALRGFAGALDLHLDRLADVTSLFPHADLPEAGGIEAHARIRLDAALRPELDTLRLDAGAADLSRLRPGLALARLTARADGPETPIALDATGTLGRSEWKITSRDLATPAFWSHPEAQGPFALEASLGRANLSLAGTLARRHPGFEVRDAAIRLHDVDPVRIAALLGRPLGWRVPGPVDLDGIATLLHAPQRDALDIDAASTTVDGDPLPPSHWTFRFDAGRDATLDATPRAGGGPWLRWARDLAASPHRETLALDAAALPATLPTRALGIDGISGSLAAKADLVASDTAQGGLAPRSVTGSFDLLLSRGRIDAALARETLAPLLGPAKTFLLHGLGSQELHCASAAGRIAGGVATLSTLSLDTPSLTLDGRGTIDLVTRTLAITLEPQIRLGPAGASSPVSLTGPIGSPHAALARAQGDRFTLSFGSSADLPNPACDLAPGIGVPVRKAPKPLDMLRSLGLFR